MIPPIYRIAKQSAQVLTLLGSPEPRLYPWGQNEDEPRVYPYATFQLVGGAPENTLACRPDMDRATIQVDVWAKTPSSARSVADALRDAIELDCYITAWRGESRDPDTNNYRVSFDCDWLVER